MQIRLAVPEDCAEVGAIYNHFIRTSTAVWRWTPMDEAALRAWFFSHDRPSRPMAVAVEGDKVVGFACLSDFRPTEGYYTATENSVYLLPGFEGLGIGHRLMDLVEAEGRRHGVRVVVAVIDEANAPSIAFHARRGYVTCGTLRDVGLKFGTSRSSVYMQKTLSEAVPEDS